MSITGRAYDSGVRLLRGVSPLLARGDSKIARGIRERSDARETFRRWGEKGRDPARPCVWFHAPSVGEGLQARAALEALRRLTPGVQAIQTWFSPSAQGFGRGGGADVAGPLPWDVRSELEALLDVVRPNLIAFTKTEVWPGLTAAAVERGIPVILIAATLPEGAGRLKPLARRLLSPTFTSLSAVLAIGEDDARRFPALGVEEGRIRVTGDPGIDSAWRRAGEADPEAPYLRPFLRDPRPTLVAGSTWPADERVLLPALETILERHGRDALRTIVAPHEPDEDHLQRLEEDLHGRDFHAVRLGDVERSGLSGREEVIVVDRVGILAHLYTVGSMAYVGGGFGTDGLHSVLEPAAAGLPVSFGPHHANAKAAGELEQVGGGAAVAGADGLAGVLEGWLVDEGARKAAGLLAGGYIGEHRGAAVRTAEAMETYLPPFKGASQGSQGR